MKYKALLGADLSGSLGGITASTNKSGGYFRIRKSPTQPNTSAQLNAKANFGKAASLFRTLAGVAINSWNNFALNRFSPRNNTNTGQYSGQQSFQALNVGFNNSITANKTFSVEVNGAVLPGGETFDNFDGPLNIAPVNSSSANLKLTAGGSTPISLLSGTLSAAGIATFKCQVGTGAGEDIVGFQNAFGDAIGFAIFCSNGNPSQNMNFASPERYLIGYLNPIIVTVPADVSAIANFELTLTQALLLELYKSFPSVGEKVQLSVYAITKSNQMNLIGRVPVTIS